MQVFVTACIFGEKMKKRKEKAGNAAELLLMAVALVAFIVVAATMINHDDGYLKIKDPVAVTEGWYVIDSTGQRQSVDVTAAQSVDDGSLVLYNDELTKSYSGYMITTSAAQYGLRISVGDELIYEYIDGSFRLNTQMKANLFCDVQIPEGSEAETAVFEYSNIESGSFIIPDVKVGSARDVLWEHCEDGLFVFIIAIVLMFIAIAELCLWICLKRIQIYERRLLDIALFIIICCLWAFSNSPQAQQLCSMPDLMYYISFCMFMFMCVPICGFMLHTEGLQAYRSIHICMLLFYMNFVLQNIVHFAAGIDMSSMLFITHALIACDVVIIIRALLLERRKNKRHEIDMITFAFALLGLCGVVAIVIYWMYRSLYSGYILIYMFGIFAFVMTLVCSTAASLLNGLQLKSENDAYERLSSADLMTGLENYTTFQKDLTRMERNAGQYRNIAIIFISLSGMKDLNGRYGYKKGDEIIVTAANSIRRLFGNIGKCYRTFGDEFCVIIPDPADPAEDEKKWGEMIAAEAAHINRNGYYNIQVHWGCSFIRDDAERIRPVSDWKYDAYVKLRSRQENIDIT